MPSVLNPVPPVRKKYKVVGNIKQQIAAWQRKQTEENLRNMKEHVDFDVHVKLSEEGTTCSAFIECKNCNTKQSLGMSV